MNYPSFWPCQCGLNKRFHDVNGIEFNPMDNLTYFEWIESKNKGLKEGIPEAGRKILKSDLHVRLNDGLNDRKGIW